MAETEHGARLTEAHRLAQQQVRNDFLAEFVALWALLDSTRLDDTSPGWVRAVMRVIEAFRLRSAQVATSYYFEFRAVEAPSPAPRPRVERPRIELPPGVERPAPRPPDRPVPAPQRQPPPAPARPSRSQPVRTPEPVRRQAPQNRPDPVVPRAPREPRVTWDFEDTQSGPRPERTARINIDIPDIDWGPSDRAAKVSLEVTGPVGQKSKAKRGKPLQVARDESFVQASGAAARHVLTGGRQSLLTLLDDDPQAVGWFRVTDGDPCAFCALLASRGPVYKSETTAGFQAHDHCACTAEPAYSRSAPWPGRGAEFRRLYRQVTQGTSGRDSLNAFRRAYEQRQRDARRDAVA